MHKVCRVAGFLTLAMCLTEVKAWFSWHEINSEHQSRPSLLRSGFVLRREAEGRVSSEHTCSDVRTAPDCQATVHIPPASFERTHARMKRIPASPSSAEASACVDADLFPSGRAASASAICAKSE